MISKLTEIATERKSQGLKMSSRESYAWLLKKIAELKSPVKVATGITAEQHRTMTRFILGNL